MLTRNFTTRLLSPGDLEPSHEGLKVIGVFNPGVVRFGDQVLILARVVEKPTEKRKGKYPAPRFDVEGGFTVDWLDAEQTDAASDPRCYFSKAGGSMRLRFISHLRLFRSDDGRSITPAPGSGPTPATDLASAPLLLPEGEYETFGIEDPRITKIKGTYYITYVAVSPRGVCTCLMSTTDFRQYHRHGVIFCPDNKDVVLFPERIMGDYIAMHRPMPNMPFSPPQVWIARSPDLTHWGTHLQLLSSTNSHTDAAHRDRIGGGTPPVKTDRGWLTLYHGSDKKPGAKGAGRYTAGAILIDLNNPTRIVARTAGPIIVPQEPYEVSGFVNHVVFPTAVLEDGDEYLVYGGAADEHTTVIGYDKTELLATLR